MSPAAPSMPALAVHLALRFAAADADMALRTRCPRRSD